MTLTYPENKITNTEVGGVGTETEQQCAAEHSHLPAGFPGSPLSIFSV